MTDAVPTSNRPPMPQILTQIWGSPAMKAALQLSEGAFTDRSYYAGIMNLSEVASYYSPGSWAAHCQMITKNYPNGIPGMMQDVDILCRSVTEWEDIREIWKGWLLTTVCMPHIFTKLAQQGKVKLSDLRMEDREMFDYTEQQMESFMKIWIAILAFGETRGRIGALLKDESKQ